MEWQARTALMTGEEGVLRLQNAAVAVLGVGGVGSYTAEALARAGVGRLVLIDRDTVAASNINRQLVALHSTIGQPKVSVMAARISDIHPGCLVQPYELFYTPEEGQGLIDGCDYVADAMDNLTAKLALAAECRDKAIPLISAMGCGNKWDATRFRIADITETKVCPLCRLMRRELKQRNIPHLQVVYSEEPPVKVPVSSAGERPATGSLSFVPSVAGLLMAGEIIKKLLI